MAKALAPNTMMEIYESPAALKDIKYRGWLTDLNHHSKFACGAEVYYSSKALRRWFVAGWSAYDALKAIHGQR